MDRGSSMLGWIEGPVRRGLFLCAWGVPERQRHELLGGSGERLARERTPTLLPPGSTTTILNERRPYRAPQIECQICMINNFAINLQNCRYCVYLIRRQETHPISHLPGKLHKLLWRQTGVRFNIRVLVISVIESPALPQVTQKVSIRDIFNDHHGGF